MTTTLPPRGPSPADMPGAREAARRLIEPGQLPPGRDFRPLYELGITRAGLGSHPLLVALVLATRCDWTTGVIPANRQAGLTRLADETRLYPGQVVVALNTLATRGWVAKVTGGSYYTARLGLTIPAPIMARLLRG